MTHRILEQDAEREGQVVEATPAEAIEQSRAVDYGASFGGGELGAGAEVVGGHGG
jgi:hypothetical protein